jgi:hypothetical protein
MRRGNMGFEVSEKVMTLLSQLVAHASRPC